MLASEESSHHETLNKHSKVYPQYGEMDLCWGFKKRKQRNTSIMREDNSVT